MLKKKSSAIPQSRLLKPSTGQYSAVQEFRYLAIYRVLWVFLSLEGEGKTNYSANLRMKHTGDSGQPF